MNQAINLILRRNNRVTTYQAPEPQAVEETHDGQVLIDIPQRQNRQAWVPQEMAANGYPDFSRYLNARLRCDFQFWCRSCVRIPDMATGRIVPFVLNRPQRRILAELERQRRSGQGINLILLKTRRCGATTLFVAYIAWLQMMHCPGSAAYFRAGDSAHTGRQLAIYNRILERYPPFYKPTSDTVIRFRNFEGQSAIRFIENAPIAPNAPLVIRGSAQARDSARGMCINMALFSEVDFWRGDPEPTVSIVTSALTLGANSVCIIESSARSGRKNSFFAGEWHRAVRGYSDMVPLFIPWYECETCRLTIPDPVKVWSHLDPYERQLVTVHGCTLEQAGWYHAMRGHYGNPSSLIAAYPTTPAEALTLRRQQVIAPVHVHITKSPPTLPRGVQPVGPRGRVAERRSPQSPPAAPMWVHRDGIAVQSPTMIHRPISRAAPPGNQSPQISETMKHLIAHPPKYSIPPAKQNLRPLHINRCGSSP